MPLTSIYAGEVVDEAELPLRLMAYTPCYRREAGSAGRDTRGMLRAHEFDKVEILAVATPEQAPALLVEMVGRAERTIAGLGLPYRIIEICTGDMGQSHHRSFDIEVYAPGCRPVARGLVDLLVQRLPGAPRRHPLPGRRQKGTQIAHTLNGSALAVPRVWAAIVENYREADGASSCPRCCVRTCAASSDRRRVTRSRDDRWLAGDAIRDGGCSTRRPGSTSATSTRPDGAVAAVARRRFEAGVAEPNAMMLDGRRRRPPDARIVLVRGADERGFAFFTNYESSRAASSRRSARHRVFSWLDLHRQVRVRGHVERLDAARATRTSRPRPRASQIGAWASPQSR